MRSDFEKLIFHPDTEGLVQFCKERNHYVVNELVVHTPNLQLALNTLLWVGKSWAIYQHQQSKVDELQGQLNFQSAPMKSKNSMIDQLEVSNNELQKRLDAVKQLIQVYKDEEKELELKEWEQSTIYGRIAIELEQALKGEG